MAKVKVKSNHTADINMPIVGGVLRAGATRVVDRWEVVEQTDEIKPLLETNIIEVVQDAPAKPTAKPRAKADPKPKGGEAQAD